MGKTCATTAIRIQGSAESILRQIAVCLRFLHGDTSNKKNSWL